MESVIADGQRVRLFAELARGEEWLTWAAGQHEFQILFDPGASPTDCTRFVRSGGPVWLQIPNTIDGFDSVGALIDESPLVGNVRNDDGHIWLPLPMTPELEWTPLADELFERVLEIRQVIESPPEAVS